MNAATASVTLAISEEDTGTIPMCNGEALGLGPAIFKICVAEFRPGDPEFTSDFTCFRQAKTSMVLFTAHTTTKTGDKGDALPRI
jgi:hypothetical protein